MTLTIHKALEDLGLSKNEAIVYLAVLELGEPTVGDIEEQAGIHKQLIYNAATQLQDKGLMSITYIRQRRHFSVTDPSALEKQQREKLAKARSLVTELYTVTNRKRTADQTRIFKGVKGIQQYYNQTIRKQPKEGTIYILGVNSKRYFEIFNPNDFPYQSFERARLEQKVQMRLILFGAEKEEITLNRDRKYFDLRLMPEEHRAPIDIVVWDDRVALLFYAADPYLIDIIGKDTAAGFRQYFNALWKTARQVRV